MTEPNDTDGLMQRVASGNSQARAVILGRYRERLKQMVRLRMHSRVQARFDPSDVVQEALLIANRRLDELATQRASQPHTERIPIYVWLRKITWEQLIKFHERHIQAAKRSVASEMGQLGDLNESSVQLLVDRFAAKPSAGEQLPDHLERGEIIRQALNSLKRQDREILELRYLEQLSNLEIAASLAAIAWYFLGDWLSLPALAEREQELRDFQDRNPLLVYALAFGIYVLVTGLSLPGATVMTLLLAWYFGFWEALVLISFASTAGATLAFLLSRFLFRDLVQSRFQQQLEGFHRAFEQQGPLFLFSLRLIPAVPFFVINAVMGLTNIKTQTFWWVSQLGMLPGTAVYVYAGSRVPSLSRLAEDGVNAVLSPQQVTQILIALVLLGFFPWLAKLALNYLQRHRARSS